MKFHWNASKTLRSLSLGSKLGLLFSGLFLLLISFFGALVYQQELLASRAVSVARGDTLEMRWINDLSDRLTDAGRTVLSGGPDEAQINEIDRLVMGLIQNRNDLSETNRSRLSLVHDEFNAFVRTATGPGRSLRDPKIMQHLNLALAATDEVERTLLAQVTSGMRQLTAERARALKTSVVLFLLLFLAALYLAIRVIKHATQPLTELSLVLDGVRVESDLDDQIPALEWGAPEVSRLAESFSQLLERLRSYRAVNVRRLLMEKRRADVIAAAISDGIFLLRGEEVMYCNPVGERILALPPGKSARGLKLSRAIAEAALIASGDAKNTKPTALSPVEALQRSINSTIPVEFEVSVDDNRKLHFLLQAFPISDDIIEQVEHSMNAPIDRLLDRWQPNILVLARDVTLVHESQEAKSHFIATLSHEVKTPVTSLTMATRLLKKGVDQIPNPNHRALVETCATDVDRLRGLIEELLSVSRFDSLAQTLDIKRVDIGKLVRQSVRFYQPEAFGRGIEMSCEIDTQGKAVTIDMDATKISWALSNLLVNALRHTPKDGRVQTSLKVSDKFVEIRIRDSGAGIERNRLEKLFDKFDAHYDLRVARTGSVGMGLAIAREIVTAHGGQIWVTSEVGHGAEFCFNLPVMGAGSLASGSAKLSDLDHFNHLVKGEKTNGATARS